MGIGKDVLDIGLRLAGAFGAGLQDLARDRLFKAEGESQTTGPGGRDQDSAEGNPPPDKPAKEDPKSLFWDPFALVEQLGYKDRPSQVTYGTLRAIVRRMPVVGAVINTRIDQVANFTTPQENRFQVGFRVKLRDSKRSPSKVERKWTEQMEQLLLRTGVTKHPRGRDGFETFIRKIAFDSLTFDQTCVEIVPDRKGRPCEWYAVDAATIRLADQQSARLSEDDTESVRYVQVYDGMVISEYTQAEMAWGVRHPRTDIRLFGYGESELEQMITAITSLLWAWEYNQKFFSQGSSAKGILNFKGTISNAQLEQFRRHWYLMLSGVENAWRTPITNAEELQWVNLQSNNRDMEYNAWMDFLIKCVCAFYSMDPSEINFKYGNVGQKSGLTEDSNAEKVSESRERGLRPLLRHFAGLINRNILWPTNESFEFEFVGLDAMTRDKAADLVKKQVTTIRTVDELRAEDDLPPLPDGEGKIILDSVFQQARQAREAQAQQAQQAQQGGQPGEPGQPGPEGAAAGGQPPGGQQGQQPGPEGEGEEPDFEQLLSQYERPEEPAEAAKSLAAGSLARKIVVDLNL